MIVFDVVSGCRKDVKWEPLEMRSWLVNINATTNYRLDTRGFRIVIRDWQGDILLSRPIHWPSPLSAKAMAVKWGQTAVLEVSLHWFTVASDCSNVVKMLNGNNNVLNDYGVIIDEIIDLVKIPQYAHFSFMLRNSNLPANCIC